MVRPGTVDEMLEIMNGIPEFENPYSKAEFQRRLSSSPSLTLIYEKEGLLVGFKCGYQRDENSTSFYSWMGGVLPAYRSKQVASQLLHEMEKWCRMNGFEELTFKTRNQHKTMLIFALKHHFEIVAVENKSDKTPRIWLSKKLQ